MKTKGNIMNGGNMKTKVAPKHQHQDLPELKGTLKDFLCGIYQTSRQLLDHAGELQPIVFFVRHDKVTDKIAEGGVIPCGMQMPESQQGKDAVAQMMKSMGYRLNATAMLSILESWQSSPPEGLTNEEAYQWALNNPPSLDPNRKEIVMYTLEVKGVGSYTVIAEMTRDENDKPSIPEVMPENTGYTLDGRFSGILEYNPKNPNAFELGLTDTPDIEGIGVKTVTHDGSESSFSDLDHEQNGPKNFGKS